MKISNDTYEVLKWIGLMVLPALSILINTIGTSFGYIYTKEVVDIINAIGVFIGTIIGVSTYNYYKEDGNEY